MGMEDYELDKMLEDGFARIKGQDPAPAGPMKKIKVDKENPCQGCVDNWNRVCDTYNRAYAQMMLVDPIFEPCPHGENCANEVRRKEQG